MTDFTIDKPIIKIKREAYNKLWNYIMACDTEISGLGHAYLPRERDPETSNKDVVVEDILLFKQKCSGASTKLDKEDLQTKQFEMTKAGDFRPFNVWWHSHVRMQTYFSGTDENTIRNTFPNAPWMIHIVGNKYMDYNARVVVYKPLFHIFEECKIEVFDEEPGDIVPEDIRKEVDDKVNRALFGVRHFDGKNEKSEIICGGDTVEFETEELPLPQDKEDVAIDIVDSLVYGDEILFRTGEDSPATRGKFVGSEGLLDDEVEVEVDGDIISVGIYDIIGRTDTFEEAADEVEENKENIKEDKKKK